MKDGLDPSVTLIGADRGPGYDNIPVLFGPSNPANIFSATVVKLVMVYNQQMSVHIASTL